MRLSKRLKAMLDLSPPADVIADIGCDHGFLPIAFIQGGKAKYAIACDISEKSIEKAKQNMLKYGLDFQIELRTGDGITALKKDEAGIIAVSGMGGRTIAGIVEKSSDITGCKAWLLLSPNNKAGLLRKQLIYSGYDIIKEELVMENTRIYPVLLAKKGGSGSYAEMEYEFGRILIKKKHPLLKPLLEKRMRDMKKTMDTAKKADNKRAKEAYMTALEKLIEYGRLYKCL